ncbi:hypothetical protein GF343_01335 [Candidatus Woesearchaeota archaeon]|nr:hypothetical protein [Candidatus Woesearchaeota archaeon]
MTNYTSADVRNAEQILSADFGLALKVARLASSGSAEDFSGIDSGSLLIAAARMDRIHFMQAHTALVEVLRQNDEQISYDSAVQSAYDILDEHGVITDERIKHLRETVIPDLAEDLGVSVPEEQAKIYDFYEERARQKGSI